jgi:hypothetical protein
MQERSFMIYKFYTRRGFTNEQMEPLIQKDRINNWSNATYPFVAYWGFKYGLQAAMPRTFLYKMTPLKARAFFGGLTAVSWWVWMNQSPFYKSMLQEKEMLLWRLYEKVGLDINNWNEMIPRSWSEDYIHMLIRRTYRERTSSYKGMITPTEQVGGFRGDPSYLPQENDAFKQKY